MPIYEYACPGCRHTFEEWLKSDDAAATLPCPQCGEPSPRILSNTSFILKGGGWYVTEYGSHKNAEEQHRADVAESADAGAKGGEQTPADAKAEAAVPASGESKAEGRAAATSAAPEKPLAKAPAASPPSPASAAKSAPVPASPATAGPAACKSSVDRR